MRDSRRMPVPVGLDGLRVDSGLSKLLGLSRTVVADLASSGDILIDGVPASKSDRLTTDSWLDVTLPESRSIADEPAREVEGMDICTAIATSSSSISRWGWLLIRRWGGMAPL